MMAWIAVDVMVFQYTRWGTNQLVLSDSGSLSLSGDRKKGAALAHQQLIIVIRRGGTSSSSS